MFSDLKFALRSLLNTPAFTLVAVVTLAIGIGANTAIFSLINDFLLRSLPVKNPDELVLFRYVSGAQNGSMSRAEWGNSQIDPASGLSSGTSFSLLTYQRFAVDHPGLSDVFAFATMSDVSLLVDGQPELSTTAQFASGNYYAGLGVPAVLGRTITPDDDRPGAEPVAVISYRYWQSRFGRALSVLGRTLMLNHAPVTIVGVSAQGFEGAGQVGESIDVTVPLAQLARFRPGDASDLHQPWYWWVRIMGRIAPGSSASQARASLEPIFQNTAQEGWETGRSMDQTPQPTPAMPTLAIDSGAQGENDTRREYQQSLKILMGLVGLVLLAACTNVANLLLARGAARRQEFAVRLALGAGRARIIRQLLIESLLLAGLGAAFGILIAWWSPSLLLALRPFGNTSVVLDLPLDGRVLGFTLAVTFGTALLFGLAPALRATRLDLNAEFQGGTRSAAGGRRSRVNAALMVLQIALSLVLLVSTGLFIRTLRNLQQIEAGFNRRQLLLFRLDATPEGYPAAQYSALQARVLDRLQHLPGVQSATCSQVALLSHGLWSIAVNIPGYTPPPGVALDVPMNAVAPNFFTTLGIPLVLGRGFTDHDNHTAPKVAVVNQAFAHKYFPGENAIGRHFFSGRGTSATEIAIVGVVGDAKYRSLRDAIPPTVYLPMLQRPSGNASFALRVSGNMTALFPSIRAAVREIDASLPVLDLRTQDEQIDRTQGQELLFARLSGYFGLLALTLACVGLYGLMSYSVLLRTREIGIRMALGAVPADMLRMILRDSLGLVGLGVCLGLTAATVAARLVATMLFGISPLDPITFGAVALLLIGISLLAAFLPARRAARIDPLVALRAE